MQENDLRRTRPPTEPRPYAGAPGASPAVHVLRARPDARPMRVALGAGGLAALSALLTAIALPVRSPAAAPVAGSQQMAPGSTPTPITLQRPIQYVQLQPGQTAPPGATVIDPAAPQPTAVVITVPGPTQATIVVRTTQSGKVIP